MAIETEIREASVNIDFVDYQNQQAASLPAGVKLGYIVMWSLRKAVISRHELTYLLHREGLGAYLPNPVSVEKALKRSIQKMLRERSGNNTLGYDDEEDLDDDDEKTKTKKAKNAYAATGVNYRGRRDGVKLVRRIKTKHAQLVSFGVIIENFDLDNESLDYGTEFRVSYNRATQVIRVAKSAAGDIEAEGAALDDWEATGGKGAAGYNKNVQLVGGYASDEERKNILAIRREVQNNFDWYSQHYISMDIAAALKDMCMAFDGTSLRGMGGVYFVPVTHEKKLHTLQDLVLNRLGIENNSEFTLIAQLDVENNRATFATMAQNECLEELATLEQDLRTMAANVASDDRDVRSSTVNKRFEEYNRLKAKAETLASVLGLQKKQILSKLDGLEDEAKTLLITVGKSEKLRKEQAAEAKAKSKKSSSSDVDADGVEQEQEYRVQDMPGYDPDSGRVMDVVTN